MRRALVGVLVVLCIAAQACASALPATPAQLSPSTVTPAAPTEFVPTAVPITPTFEGCAYVWASQDLPELSRRLNAELQKTSDDVTGLAYAYGENCVYGDGHATFSAMETDYRIGVKVTTVRDEGTLGEWIRKVMNIVLELPPDQLQGPQPGRVDFDFKQPDPAELFVTVPIDKYRQEADNLRGADLLHLFYPTP
jgi:hypothetical protein